MARKKKHEDHVNHEAWAIPYADLLVLLLAFFVVMYSISSVNEGKYRVLSDTLVNAFTIGEKKPTALIGDEKQGVFDMQASRDGIMAQSPGQEMVAAPVAAPAPYHGDRVISADEVAAMEATAQAMADLLDEIRADMMPLIESGLVVVTHDKLWIEVDIQSGLLFASGSAKISPEAVPAIEKLAKVLQDQPVRVNVEGFTDNVPINTSVYPSNWELSAARAASVVSLLADMGVDPSSLAAIGYGEFRPIASNMTADGRRQNRRVVLVILAEEEEGANGGVFMRDVLRGRGSAGEDVAEEAGIPAAGDGDIAPGPGAITAPPDAPPVEAAE